ncbi:hypothetical protein LGH70_23075 [Hymenobacter sp. BT635]|uniref:Uncharacterized protein n=1 Tax=Hymenobacter nitidus TaxID=2880929 RepID=A0ABS8AMR0_9BACT|nr:hypothetical protein [Hymenobacter nitidus]MCB2380495.1 hypothetical protein [Hymenobacter nitidus]
MTPVKPDTEDADLYRYCTSKENISSLSELCKHCPIPTRIQSGLPRIWAEIAIQRQGNTRDGFRKYCKEALDNHIKKAAQYANDLANPFKMQSLNVGQCLEIKFWNLALCELYKSEMEKLYPAALGAPPITIELLPDDVAHSHAYFTELLSVCAKLPPHDVAYTLRNAFEQYRSRGFYAWASFVERLPTYISQHLSADVQKMLERPGGLLSSFRAKLRIAELQPENWPFWGLDERPRILRRQQDVKERLELAQQEGRVINITEHTDTLACIDRILAALDAAGAAGNIVVNASELNSLSSSSRTEQQESSVDSPLLTPAALHSLYLKALQHPALVEELSPYQKSELRVYAEQEKMNGVRLAVDLMEGNPSHAYPSEYQNGREAEYWMDKIASYRDSLQVLQLLNSSGAKSSCVDLAPPLVSYHLFEPLLLNYTVDQLRGLLQKLGLVAIDGRAMPAATPGAWVGVIHGLLDAKPPRLRNNKAAIQRAFREHFGAVVGERAVQAGVGKRGSEAEQFRDRTLDLLPAAD